MPCHTRMKTTILLGVLWLCLINFGMVFSVIEPGFLDFDNLPDTNFSCVGKVIGGYYADLETSCQMFHVCTIGQLDEPMDIRFLCLNGTVFDQETRVCERIDEVDCTKSEKFYHLNLELYGNTAPPIVEEPDPTIAPKPTTTTQRTTTTTRTTRVTFTTTTTQQTPKILESHHFPVSSGADIRFNPEEINIRLTPGSPPIIKAHHQRNPQLSYHQHYTQPRISVTTHGNIFKDYSTTTQKLKSVVSYKNYHHHNYDYHYQQTENSDLDYNTELPSGYGYSDSNYDADLSKEYSKIQPPTTKKPQIYHTEKPTLQIPHSLIPTLPPFTISTPAPFSLRHFDQKRSHGHHETPRIIISASASVSDASGRRLNYSLGTIGASHIIGTAPTSYDEYRESDVGLDPFYHDVPKINAKKSRQKRQIKRGRAKWVPPDYVDDNYEPLTYEEPTKNLNNTSRKEPSTTEGIFKPLGTTEIKITTKPTRTTITPQTTKRRPTKQDIELYNKLLDQLVEEIIKEALVARNRNKNKKPIPTPTTTTEKVLPTTPKIDVTTENSLLRSTNLIIDTTKGFDNLPIESSTVDSLKDPHIEEMHIKTTNHITTTKNSLEFEDLKLENDSLTKEESNDSISIQNRIQEEEKYDRKEVEVLKNDNLEEESLFSTKKQELKVEIIISDPTDNQTVLETSTAVPEVATTYEQARDIIFGNFESLTTQEFTTPTAQSTTVESKIEDVLTTQKADTTLDLSTILATTAANKILEDLPPTVVSLSRNNQGRRNRNRNRDERRRNLPTLLDIVKLNSEENLGDSNIGQSIHQEVIQKSPNHFDTPKKRLEEDLTTISSSTHPNVDVNLHSTTEVPKTQSIPQENIPDNKIVEDITTQNYTTDISTNTEVNTVEITTQNNDDLTVQPITKLKINLNEETTILEDTTTVTMGSIEETSTVTTESGIEETTTQIPTTIGSTEEDINTTTERVETTTQQEENTSDFSTQTTNMEKDNNTIQSNQITPNEDITTRVEEPSSTTEKLKLTSTRRYNGYRSRSKAYRRNGSTTRHRFSSPTISMSPNVLKLQNNRRITTEAQENLVTDPDFSKSVNPTESKSPLSTTPLNKMEYTPKRGRKGFNCLKKDLNRFYEDPRDCRLFHYCTNGFTDTQVLDMKFVCDLGTYFDIEKLICTKNIPSRCI